MFILSYDNKITANITKHFITKKASDGVNMLKGMIGCIFLNTEKTGDLTFADFRIDFDFNRFLYIYLMH